MKWCEECEHRSYRSDVCTNCGFVFEDHPLDMRSPLKEYDSTVDRHIVARSRFLKNIKKKTRVNIRECESTDLRRALRNYYYDWDDQRDYRIKEELKRVCELIGLTKDFYASCVYFYTKLCKFNDESKVNMFKGGREVTLEIVAQGIIYYQIRVQKLPFTFYDFVKADCDVDRVKSYYTRLLREMDLKVERQQPQLFIARIVGKLQLKPRDQYLLTVACRNFCDNYIRIEEAIHSLTLYKFPIIKTTAIIYALANKLFDVSQRNICELVGCDIRTLRKRVQEMRKIFREKIDHYGFKEEVYDNACLEDEYCPLIENGSKVLEKGKLFVKGLIHPDFEMELCKKDKKLKVLFK